MTHCTRLLTTLALLATLSAHGAAQGASSQYPLRADVESIDGIMRAFYDVVSTPAGVLPNRERDASLHAPGAQIRLSRVRQNGSPTVEVLTLDEFYARYYNAPSDRPFHEREIHRVTHRFGNIAHVWSTYAASEAPDGAPIARGISSVQLYFDGERWWITGWMDERESAVQPLPREFLP